MLASLIKRLAGWTGTPSASSGRTARTGGRAAAGANGAKSSRTARAASLPVPPPIVRPRPEDGPDEREALRSEFGDAIASRAAELGEQYTPHKDASDALALLEALVRGGSGLIRQPPLAAQAVLAVFRRRHYSLDQITTLVERDPSLAQTLLRHANSAWYATPGAAPVVAIGAAVQRIGTAGVHSTVMSTIIAGTVSRPGARYNEIAKQVWDHMVRVAPLARRLARPFGANAEQAFTLGLAHDVGKLILFDQVAEHRRRLRREVRLPDRFLSDALRTLHEPLGGLAAIEWGLSPHFARTVSTHHRSPVPKEAGPLNETIFCAERVDLEWQMHEEVDLEALWSEGGLTGSQSAVQRVVSAILAEQDEAAR